MRHNFIGISIAIPLDGKPNNPTIRIDGFNEPRKIEVTTESLFKALADPTRRRLLAVLGRSELGVSELVELLRQPQSTVSRHLKVLREAGLIVDRRNGHSVWYSLPALPPADSAGEEELPSRLLTWVREEALPPTLESRLQGIILRRCEASDRFFARAGAQWDRLREESFGDRFYLEALLGLLPADWRVADIGSGTGYLLPILARHFERVIGIEPIDEMRSVADARVRAEKLSNVELRRGDLAHLPIEDASVDLALAVLVLHHVPAPRGAIHEIIRVVRPGGRILIVEQCVHHNRAFRERMQDRWWGFEPEQLSGILQGTGLREVRWRKLTTVERAADAPELFIVTGARTELAPFDGEGRA